MKKICTLITATALAISALAQIPEKMSYQAVIRNSNNQLVTNQAVAMQISIVHSTADGAVVYSETHNPTTNANGLLSIEIGTGTTSDDFASINWANGPYFIKTETDPAGGTNYTITGTSQLLSVPYALHAKTAETLTNAIPETDPLFSSSVASSITSTDVNNWNNSLTGITETDPLFATSVANSIKTSDIDNWNNKIGEITGNELPFTNWDKNANDDFDGNYNSLTNRPNFNDSISNKAVLLTGDQVVAGNKTFTGAIHPYYIEVNSFGTGNRNAFIDFHGDDTYTDYSLRLARYNTGMSILEHRGTGLLTIQASDSAHIRFATKGIQRMRIEANGNVWVNGQMLHDKTLRVYDQSNKVLFFRQDGEHSYISNKQNFLGMGTTKNGWLHINGESGVSLRVGRDGAAGIEAMRVDTFTNIDMLNHQVINIKTPVNDKDAANKAYVDALKLQIKILEDNLIESGTYKIKDIEGNKYSVIKIGDQIWMSENLKTTKYNDGTEIPHVTSDAAWGALTTPGYCWYNNNYATYGNTYGAIYNWYVVETGKICPIGWHVPSDEEWTTLSNHLIENYYNYDGSITQNKIAKSMATTTNWMTSTVVGAVGNTDYPIYRNKSNFSATPGGYRSILGLFYGQTFYIYYWSTLPLDISDAIYRGINYSRIDLFKSNMTKAAGMYIRCVKDL